MVGCIAIHWQAISARASAGRLALRRAIASDSRGELLRLDLIRRVQALEGEVAHQACAHRNMLIAEQFQSAPQQLRQLGVCGDLARVGKVEREQGFRHQLRHAPAACGGVRREEAVGSSRGRAADGLTPVATPASRSARPSVPERHRTSEVQSQLGCGHRVRRLAGRQAQRDAFVHAQAPRRGQIVGKGADDDRVAEREASRHWLHEAGTLGVLERIEDGVAVAADVEQDLGLEVPAQQCRCGQDRAGCRRHAGEPGAQQVAHAGRHVWKCSPAVVLAERAHKLADEERVAVGGGVHRRREGARLRAVAVDERGDVIGGQGGELQSHDVGAARRVGDHVGQQCRSPRLSVSVSALTAVAISVMPPPKPDQPLHAPPGEVCQMWLSALSVLRALDQSTPSGAFVGPARFGQLRGRPELLEVYDSARSPATAARLWELTEQALGEPLAV